MEKLYYLGFSLFPGIGPVLLEKLITAFGSVEEAWNGEKKELQEVVGPILLEKFLAFRKEIDLGNEYEKCVQKGVKLVTVEDKEYPTLLKELRSKNSELREEIASLFNGELAMTEENSSGDFSTLDNDKEGQVDLPAGRQGSLKESSSRLRQVPDGSWLRSNNKPSTSLRQEPGSLVKPGMTGELSNRAIQQYSNRHVPFLLYVKGDTHVLSSLKTIGIVGTRKITPYGRQVTDMLTRDLVHEGFITVSGLAFGVDAAVHTVTMDEGGKTIAVLGCGVDCCYPRENSRIYEKIIDLGGAVVSTFPPGMQPSKGSFPARNAIIAGLSQAVLVTEGAEDSGSLITAKLAQQCGRPVFAVPGPITSSLSKGVNKLLKQGAIAVTDARDIIITLYSSSEAKYQAVPGEVEKIDKNSSRLIPLGAGFTRTIKGESKEEREIIELLENGPLHFDEIVRTIGKDSKTIGSLLSLLELKGMIKSNAEGKYSL